ncbi:MAG: TraR/DksA family transcriptional regulator [Chromatocurvus sp.]
MNETEAAVFRKRLEQLRHELLDTAESSREASQPVQLDQASVGRLSRMDAMQGQAMALESKRRRELLLRRVATALSRIDSGDYGYCLDCDEEIARPRLETDPAATLCIQCATKRERPD